MAVDQRQQQQRRDGYKQLLDDLRRRDVDAAQKEYLEFKSKASAANMKRETGAARSRVANGTTKKNNTQPVGVLAERNWWIITEDVLWWAPGKIYQSRASCIPPSPNFYKSLADTDDLPKELPTSSSTTSTSTISSKSTHPVLKTAQSERSRKFVPTDHTNRRWMQDWWLLCKW